ncbi:MAG: nucleotidyltransferase family protein [Pseudomonadota bacterium]|jgi:predicted nucleotidyltransferase
MHPLIETHGQAILDIARRYGLTNVRVFGSMARGDADENSDVDLLVTLPPEVSGLALGGLLMDVQDLTGRKVDVVTDGGLNPAVRDIVLKEAQPL